MPDSSAKSQIGVWIDNDLRERVESAAAREGRSVSGFVREMLRRQLEIQNRVYGDSSTRGREAAAS